MQRSDFEKMSRSQKISHLVKTLQSPLPATHPAASAEPTENPAQARSSVPANDLQQAYLFALAGSGVDARENSYIYQEFEIPNLDLARLERIWQGLLSTHTLLRAHMDTPAAVTWTEHAPHYSIEVVRVASEAELEDLRAGFANWQPQRWPLFRLLVSERAGQPHRLHIALDLLLADARSLWRLFGELEQAYLSADAERSADEPTPSVLQQALRQYARDADPSAVQLYWRKKFANAPPAPSLPAPATTTSRQGSARISATLPCWPELLERAQQQGVGPGVVLLSAFAEALSELCKAPELTVVYSHWHRPPVHPRLELAFFEATTVCWYTREPGAAGLEARIDQARVQIEQDAQHSRPSGLAELRRQPGSPRSFPVVMTDVLQRTPGVSDAACFAWGQGRTRTAQVALDCVPVVDGETIQIHMDYDPNRVDAPWVATLLQQTCACVQAHAARSTTRQGPPQTATQDTPSPASSHSPRPLRAFLSEAERQQALFDWNRTHTEYERSAGIHQLFERQARLRPERIATRSDEGPALSYGELNRRANRLARHLSTQGLRPGELVGLCLERGHEMIVGLLAILKAGAGYVPLDPIEAKGRIETIIEKADLGWVVTNHAQRIHVDGRVSRIIAVDEQQAHIAAHRDDDLDLVEDWSTRRAYVIFTSGSTGAPKGVVVHHRPVINLIEWVGRTFSLGPSDTGLFTTALGFDLSVFDIFGMLALGGTVRVASDADRRNSERLSHLLCSEPITFWNSAPAALQLLVPFLARRSEIPNTQLRLVFLSGDWIPLSLPDAVRGHFASAEVVSLGGATEATVWSNYYRVGAIDPSWKSIPYGRPIQNARYYILDAALEPCAIGAEGDLYIGGECLSEGYLNDQTLTAAAFVPDPYADNTGGIMYRTGDRARFFRDGTIEFLGRRDFQVKIRGYRIELGEIEHRLTRHPAVTEAVVVVREDRPGDQRLVAYLVTDSPAAPPARELRDHVAAALPDYMVPNFFISIAAMPVTENGKLDRSALPWPPPQATPTAPPMPRAAPPNAGPSLAEILSDIQGMMAGHLPGPELPVDAPLFDLGATSLTIMSLADHVRMRFGCELALESLLQEPTLTSVAQMVAELLATDTPAQLLASDRPKELFAPTPKPELQPEPEPLVKIQTTAWDRPALAIDPLLRLLSNLQEHELDGQVRYMYPSAGGLYQTQVYLIVYPGGVSGLESGSYYHHPVEHRLYRLGASAPSLHDAEVGTLVPDGPSFALCLVAETAASQPLYGALSERLAALDAGYLAQWLKTRQQSAGLSLWPALPPPRAALAPALSLGESHRVTLFLLGGHALHAPLGQRSIPANQTDLFLATTTGSLIDLRMPSSGVALTAQLPSAQAQTQLKAQRLQLRACAGLPHIELPRTRISQLQWLRRATHRSYLPTTVQADRLRGLLDALRQREPSSASLVSSDRGRIQLYVATAAESIDGLPEGVYHYDLQHGQWRALRRGGWAALCAGHWPANRRTLEGAAFAIYFTADPDGLAREYGGAGPALAYIQAGMMGQALMQAQAAQGVGLCAIGSMVHEQVIADHLTERPGQLLLHALVGGGVDFNVLAQASTPAQPEPPAVPMEHAATQLPTWCNSEADGVAIVGMSCRFPDADNLDDYWANLRAGRSSFSRLSAARQAEWGSSEPAFGAFLPEISGFDPMAFGISPFEARTLDPQERLLLELAWECLEHAGYRAEDLQAEGQRVGVFIGVMWSDYQEYGAQGEDEAVPTSFHASIANRVSHMFNFRGPSVAVDTACSSGITALHAARESLNRGECDFALVGAVNLVAHPQHYRRLKALDLLSKTERCLSFSAAADGWLVGEGAAVVLLRRAAVAQAARDTVHALLLASAIGHTGKGMRYGVPNGTQLGASLEAFVRSAGLSPDDIDYVECAAPGANLTDASELRALSRAFAGGTAGLPPCPVGSVKPNVGHLESASGLSQLLKVVAQIRHRTLAPTLLDGPVNPLAQLNPQALRVNTAATPFRKRSPAATHADGPPLPTLRALIQAVSYSGTYGQLLVQTPPAAAPAATMSHDVLIPLSAASSEQLREVLRRLATHLESQPLAQVSMSDIARTLQAGRRVFNHRFATVVSDVNGLIRRLRDHTSDPCPVSPTAVFGEAGSESAAPRVCPDDVHDLAQLAAAWVTGQVELDATRTGGRVPLPTYPFIRSPHWITKIGDLGPALALDTQESTSQGPLDDTPTHAPAQGSRAQADLDSPTEARVDTYLCQVFADAAEMAPGQVNVFTPLEVYGLTSLLIVRMARRLSADLGDEVPSTLFFEHRTLASLRSGLWKSHEAGLRTHLNLRLQLATSQRPKPDSYTQLSYSTAAEGQGRRGDSQDIAVIGLAGRYPGAENVELLWRNLCAGRDEVREIPQSRWALEDFYSMQRPQRGKSYCKWGSFIDDFDAFDPLLFGISPREAAELDPQVRQFLQVSWELFESAGYSLQRLREAYAGDVGVFVGVMYNEFEYYGIESGIQGKPVSLASAHGSVANRVSYAYDFQGPSMAIDTLCSSSLVALHQAVASLRGGDCQAAVVGGVNLNLHPHKYLTISQLGMASPTGRCRPFSSDADGIVPGEAIGAVLIKPLARAERDGDDILAIIKGTAVNHGGRANGYTVPNPLAQARMVERALAQAQVHPDSISYVEAHGTGTTLGDPIEISGLSQAFAAAGGSREHRCAIGSIKGNLGHTEAASGLAGLTKVLLQMRHRQLVPSLHASVLNPAIDFDAGPFRVQRALADWDPVDEDGRAVPRRAAVSAFGAGGTNAHAILEAYAPRTQGGPPSAALGPQLVLVSARTAAQLQDYVGILRGFLQKQAAKLPKAAAMGYLAEVAHTTQTARTSLDERLAFVADDLEHLIECLCAVEDGRADLPAVHGGPGASALRGRYDELLRGRDGDVLIEALLAQRNLNKLAHLWVAGIDVHFQRLSRAYTPSRTRLPTYPFARERYWLDRVGVTPSTFAPMPPTKNTRRSGETAALQTLTQTPVQTQTLAAESGPDTHLWSAHAVWAEAELDGATAPSTDITYVVCGAADLTEPIFQALSSRVERRSVVRVTAGSHFQPDSQGYRLRPTAPTDYAALFTAIPAAPTAPLKVCFGVPVLAEVEAIEATLRESGLALTAILKGFCATGRRGQLQLDCVYEQGKSGSRLVAGALSGLCATAKDEIPELHCRILGLESMAHADAGPDLTRHLLAAGGSAQHVLQARTQGRRREVRGFAVTPLPAASTAASLHGDGTYIVSGGSGAIGRHTAALLLKHAAGTVVLLGRTAPNEPGLVQRLRALAQHGPGIIHYRQIDLGQAAEIDSLSTWLKEHCPPVRGVIHGAGTLRDALLLNKNQADFDRVFAPKVSGLLHLDRALAQEPLDFFIAYSSLVAVMGNPGQSDYGFANAFLDHFMDWRATQVREGRRRGRSLSLAWPYWADGGMQLPAASIAALAHRTGLAPLPTTVALSALEGYLFGDQIGHIMLAHGDRVALPHHLESRVRLIDSPGISASPNEAPSHASDEPRPAAASRSVPALLERIAAFLGQIAGIEGSQFNPDGDFRKSYGLSSLMLVELIECIDREFGLRLYPNELNLYSSAQRLATYLHTELSSTHAPPPAPPSPVAASHREPTLVQTSEVRPAPSRTAANPISAPSDGWVGPDPVEVPPPIFVLSAPRSGSTLLRVMLMGHERLFSPPELHLLPFEDLQARRRAFTDRNQLFLREGLIEALRDLHRIDTPAAQGLMNALEDRNLTTWQTYEYLRVLCHGRHLVDKSPTYGDDMQTLYKADDVDHNARYLFLVRNPLAVIHSFVKRRFKELLGLEGEPARLAEAMWARTNGNIRNLFDSIPNERQLSLRYEDLVSAPADTMRRICAFLGLSYEPRMIAPYEGDRLTSGLHERSLSVGDPAFETHTDIEPHLANTFKHEPSLRDFQLGAKVRELAMRLGYGADDLELSSLTSANDGRAELGTEDGDA